MAPRRVRWQQVEKKSINQRPCEGGKSQSPACWGGQASASVFQVGSGTSFLVFFLEPLGTRRTLASTVFLTRPGLQRASALWRGASEAAEEQERRREPRRATALPPATLSLSDELGSRCFPPPPIPARGPTRCETLQFRAKMKRPRSENKTRGKGERQQIAGVLFWNRWLILNTIGSILGREKSSPAVKPQAAVALPPPRTGITPVYTTRGRFTLKF